MAGLLSHELFSVERLRSRFSKRMRFGKTLQIRSLLRTREQIRKFKSLKCIGKKKTSLLISRLHKHENRIAMELQKKLLNDYVRGKFFDLSVYLVGLFLPLLIALFMKVDDPLAVYALYLAPFFLMFVFILLVVALVLVIALSILSMLSRNLSGLFFLICYIAVPVTASSLIPIVFDIVSYKYRFFAVSPLIAVVVIFTISIIYFLWEWLYDFGWKKRLRTVYPDSVIIDSMLEILYQIESSPNDWSKLEYKASLIQKLNVISTITQKNLVLRLQTFNPTLDSWLEQILSHYSARLFYYERMILLSKPDSRTKLLDSLSTDFLNILNGNWGSLPKITPIRINKNQRINLLFKTLRVITTAVLPLVVVILIQESSISVNKSLSEYIETGAIIWGILTFITALDPTINEKINTLKELTNLIPFQNKSD